eukprot:3941990-Rhodomonas_salina.2
MIVLEADSICQCCQPRLTRSPEQSGRASMTGVSDRWPECEVINQSNTAREQYYGRPWNLGAGVAVRRSRDLFGGEIQ